MSFGQITILSTIVHFSGITKIFFSKDFEKTVSDGHGWVRYDVTGVAFLTVKLMWNQD